MSYLPNPTVTINGQDFTGRTVESLSVNRGRDTVYAQPRAGYASVEIIDVTDGSLGFEVGASLIIRIQDASGTPRRIFTGLVSDFTSEVIPARDEPVVRYRVQAVGPLAILNRRNVLGGGRPEESDGDRVLAALTAGLLRSWQEFSTVTTWAEVDSETTWATIDPGFGPALIDPGAFDLEPLAASDGGYGALAVTSEAGESAKGLLFETVGGLIGYADANRRPANAAAGFLDIPFASVSVGGLRTSSSLSDLTNRVTVEFGSDDAVTAQDDFSIGRFGLQERNLRTILANQVNAETRADDFLFAHSRPSVEIEQVTLNLRGIELPLLDSLLDVDINDAIRLTGLPAKLGLLGFRGFVEGITLRVSQVDAECTLMISDEALSFGSVLWGQVGATIAWEDVDPALVWADARRVTT